MPIIGGLGSPDVPEWAPLNEQVADYVPHRTLTLRVTSTTEGEDVYRYVFDQDTRPTGIQVDRLIGDGVSWVQSQVAPMNPASFSAARVIATLYAASAVARSWPNDDQSLQRANDMEKRMDALMAGLVVSNDAAWADEDQDPLTPNTPLMPMWSFPPPDPRYDSAGYW